MGRATRAAEKQAQKDLDRRLSREAELVPCPRCNWINDELIAGYRVARYPFLRTLYRFTLLIGAIISAIFGIGGAFFGPKDWFFFLILPVCFLLFAGVVVGLRLWLCSRIRPNRDFPLAPQLPPGSPPALVRHPENGTLIPARPPTVPVISEGDWCDFQIGRHRLPAVCCGCLNPVPLGRGFNAVSLMVPWCADCELASNRTYWRIFFGAALSGWLLAAAILLPLNLQNEEFWIACLGAIGVCLLVAAVVASKRTAPVKVTSGDRSRSVVPPAISQRRVHATRRAAPRASGRGRDPVTAQFGPSAAARTANSDERSGPGRRRFCVEELARLETLAWAVEGRGRFFRSLTRLGRAAEVPQDSLELVVVGKRDDDLALLLAAELDLDGHCEELPQRFFERTDVGARDAGGRLGRRLRR